MSVWDDFENEAIKVDKFTKDQEPVLVNLLLDAVGLFAEAFSLGNNVTTSNTAIVKMSLLSHNFATLKCSVDLSLRGYYSQLNNLLRLVYENWLAFHYLKKNPKKAKLLLRRTSKRLPDPSAMLDAIEEDFDKNKLKRWYSVLCCFAHPHAAGILPQISTSVVPEETSIHYGTTFKRHLFRATAFKICIWTGVMLDDIAEWVKQSSEWHKKQGAIVERIVKFLEAENKKKKNR